MIVSPPPLEYAAGVTTDPTHPEKTDYPPFAVTADIAVFTIRDGRFHLLLVERGKPPFLGRLALPGGFLHPDEDAETAARRELLEETALDTGIGHLEQLRTYSRPDRDPRQRVVTVAFWAILPALGRVHGGTDARAADFVPVEQLEADIRAHAGPGGHLAFDHDLIVTDAIERARAKLEYTTVAAHFCPPEFTMTQLRRVYEIVWGKELEPANFRRQVEKMNQGFTERTDRTTRDLDAESAPVGPATRQPWSATRSMASVPSASFLMESRQMAAPPRFPIPEAPPERTWRSDDADAAPDAPSMASSSSSPGTGSTRRGRPAALYTKGDKDDLDQPIRPPRS
jgi:8-oxo-dGTP diphosphatase